METHSGNNYSLASPMFPQEAESHVQVDTLVEPRREVFVIFTDTTGTLAAPPMTEGRAQRLEVLVIFTDVPGTLAALHRADQLAQELEAHIRLLMPCEVPYTLPLTKPAVPVEFLEGQIRNLAGKTRLEVAAHIYLCRDKRRALALLLRPHSLIVVGGKERWWPTSEQKLARDLQKDGHHVIFVKLR